MPRGTQAVNGSHLTFGYGTLTLYRGRPFQCPSPKLGICNSLVRVWPHLSTLTTPHAQRPHAYTRSVWAPPFRSPLLRESFPFLRVLRCFSSPRAPRHTYVFSMRYPGIPLGGFPHSDISGSTLVGNSPELFAACCVLLRPLAPRHPPCALSSLIYASSLQDFFAFCSVFKVPSRLPSGDEGVRTPDLLRAREALSHLSYIPLWAFLDSNQRPFPYQRNALAV